MFALGFLLKTLPHVGIALPLIASMGASSFLLFVLPHSPMAQPWPLLGGHLIAGTIALICGHAIDNTIIAIATSVGSTILAMQLLRCLHPPAAATALSVSMIDTPLDPQLLMSVAYSVFGGALLLFFIAIMINRVILHRRYPLQHSHHRHHQQFQQAHAQGPLRLEEEDITWALGQMDGIVASTQEELMDVYELALEHAMSKKREATTNTPPQR